MSFEITTPLLARSADLAEQCARAVVAGAMEPKIANSGISGSRAMQSAVRTELAVRLAGPKLRFIEGQLASQGTPVPANAA